MVGFWDDKLGWCCFVVRGKHCWLADKPWLKPTSEQAEYGPFHEEQQARNLTVIKYINMCIFNNICI